MKDNPMPPGQPTNLDNWLQRAHLVVGVHDGNHNGLRRDGCLNCRRVYHPITINRQIGDMKAMPCLKIATGIEYRRMLNLAGNQMVATLPQRKGAALDSLII